MKLQIPGFRLGRVLGAGGMGTVLEAVEEATGRRVAIKVLNAGALALGDEAFVRLEREARAAAALRHRNLVVVHSARIERGRAWIVYELLEGGTLAGRLRERGKLPPLEAAAVAAQIAHALAALHAAGIVHRDVKPANVLFDQEGTAKLGDLGLARPSATAESLTKTGDIVGTPEYLAPEQVMAVAPAGPAADLYALGATLHALIAGAPPFAGTALALFQKHALETAPSLRAREPSCPPELSALADRLLAKEPAARGDAASVAAQLEQIVREPKDEESAPFDRRLLALPALAAAGALVAAALAVRRPPPVVVSPPPPPRPIPSRPVVPLEIAIHTRDVEVVPSDEAVIDVLASSGGPIATLTASVGTVESDVSGWRVRVPTPRDADVGVDIEARSAGGPPRRRHWRGFEGISLPDRVSPAGRDEKGHAIFRILLPGSKPLDLVYVPAGQFKAGVPGGEDEWSRERIARVDRGFFIGKTEVTESQFDTFPRHGPRAFPPNKNTGFVAKLDDLAVALSYDEAEEFCRAHDLRIPTGVEWEKAARGTDGRRFPWGDDEAHAESLCNATKSSGIEPVGSYRSGASFYGALDMAGNVHEWCRDRRGDLGRNGQLVHGGRYGSNIPDIECGRPAWYARVPNQPHVGLRPVKDRGD